MPGPITLYQGHSVSAHVFDGRVLLSVVAQGDPNVRVDLLFVDPEAAKRVALGVLGCCQAVAPPPLPEPAGEIASDEDDSELVELAVGGIDDTA
jgi:hypothetical protein